TAKKVVWNLETTSKLEKPRFIIIRLQKGSKNTLEKDCSIFDYCNLTNVRVFLNSIAYPYDNLNLDFTKNNFTLLYDMYTSFQESYYGKSIRNPILCPSTFLSNAPIIVITSLDVGEIINKFVDAHSSRRIILNDYNTVTHKEPFIKFSIITYPEKESTSL
ncbi:Uncharacterized protein FWK35_00034595, partial [Aphis craccivora]